MCTRCFEVVLGVFFRAGLPLLAPRSRTGTCTDWWEPLGFHRRFDRSGVGNRLQLELFIPRGFQIFLLLSYVFGACAACMCVFRPLCVGRTASTSTWRPPPPVSLVWPRSSRSLKGLHALLDGGIVRPCPSSLVRPSVDAAALVGGSARASPAALLDKLFMFETNCVGADYCRSPRPLAIRHH